MYVLNGKLSPTFRRNRKTGTVAIISRELTQLNTTKKKQETYKLECIKSQSVTKSWNIGFLLFQSEGDFNFP